MSRSAVLAVRPARQRLLYADLPPRPQQQQLSAQNAVLCTQTHFSYSHMHIGYLLRPAVTLDYPAATDRHSLPSLLTLCFYTVSLCALTSCRAHGSPMADVPAVPIPYLENVHMIFALMINKVLSRNT